MLDANDLEELDVNVGITEPCLPPCWQGLIPDESTTEEVMEVLNRVDSIDTSSIEYFSSDDDSMVDINWKSSLSDNPLHGGRLEITEGVLIFVEIVLEYELTVQEVIDRLGEPKLFTFLRGAESTDLAVRFLWPEHGFAVELPEYPRRTMISQDMFVMRIAYFAPGNDATSYMEGKSSSSATTLSDLYKPWEGFEDFTLP